MYRSLRLLSGYAIKWKDMSRDIMDESTGTTYKEIFLPGSLTESIREKNQYLLYNHDVKKIVSKIGENDFKLACDEIGLFYTVCIPSNSLGNKILREFNNGCLRHVSIGFSEGKYDVTSIGTKNIHLVKEAKLKEISFVRFPAYIDTEISLVETKEKELLNKIRFALNS